MYCPVCGAESTQGLNYCKRCGAGLGSPVNTRGPENQPPANLPMKLIAMFLAVIGFVSIVGLSIVAIAPSELAGKGYRSGFVAFMALLAVAATLLIDAALIKLLMHLIEITKPAGRMTPVMRQVANDRSPAQIAAPPQAMSSVTEHTTRHFEPVDSAAQPPGLRETRVTK